MREQNTDRPTARNLMKDNTFVVRSFVNRIVQESSEMTNLERLLLMQDFAIVPMIPRHFDLIEMVEVKAVFEGLGLKEPI